MRRIAATALCLLLFAVSARAFEIKEVTVGSAIRPLRWNTVKGPVRISLNPAGSADLPIGTVESALQAAMSTWQNVPSHSLRLEYAGKSTAAVSNGTDNRNSVLWVEKNWAFGSSVMAITRYSFFLSDPPELADADILVNGQNFKWNTAAAAAAHPQRALTHEIGHLIGLSHSSVLSAAMFPSYTSGPPGIISGDERAAIQFLYGAPVSDFRLITPVPGSVYTERMAEKGLPLPVFRWGVASVPQYEVEFSNTPSFNKKVKFRVSQKNSFQPTAVQEAQLLNLSDKKDVYWRVAAGSIKTASRLFRFRPSTSTSAQNALLRLDADPEELGRVSFIIFGTLTCLLVLALVLVLRYASRKIQVPPNS